MRLAKDEEYATAVLEAWRKDVSQSQLRGSDESIGHAFQYGSDTDEMMQNMNGYIVAPSKLIYNNNNQGQTQEKVPAILLWHTGAGPQDIFLRWKADILSKKLNCVVMIADLISDSDGYAWSDRGRYAAAREQVLVISQHDGMDGRWKFRQVIRAALDHLDALDYVDGDHVAALGWCFGCHPILEMGMMQEDCVKCLISYHGVFDGVHMYQSTGVDKAITADDIDDDSKSKTNVSIYT